MVPVLCGGCRSWFWASRSSQSWSGLQCVGILPVSRGGNNTASSHSHASGIASTRAFIWAGQSACATAWRRVSRGWLDFLPRTTASASDHHDLLLEQTNSKTRARFVETAFAAFLSQKKYLPSRASSGGHCRRELVYVEAYGGESEDHGGRRCGLSKGDSWPSRH